MRCLALLAALSLAPAAALAGEADVVGVAARSSGGGWSFDVTVRHADTGWEHYADAWRVVGPDGVVYGTRVLVHPHVNEQPFIPTCTDQNPCAHSRMPIEMIFHGRSISLFQASQQSATMSS